MIMQDWSQEGFAACEDWGCFLQGIWVKNVRSREMEQREKTEGLDDGLDLLCNSFNRLYLVFN